MKDNIKNIGFAIITSDEDAITHNYASNVDGGEINKSEWDQINEDVRQMEINVLSWLRDKLEGARDEGHGNDGALIGTTWYDSENSEQVDFVMSHALQADNFDSDYFNEFYKGLSELGEYTIDVRIEFFDIPDEDYEAWEDM